MPSRKWGFPDGGKLVLDGVFEGMQALGQETSHKFLEGADLVAAADKKIMEEARELSKTDKPLKELADMLAALKLAASARGISYNEVLAAQLAREEEMGGFSKGVFVEWVITPEGDEWGDYYAAHPDVFTELPLEVNE